MMARSCRALLLGLSALGPAGTASAAGAPVPVSLEQALAAAEQTNPQLLAARARLRQVDEAVPQAVSGWRPHVSVEGQIGPGLYTSSEDHRNYPERRLPQDYELTATQNLYTSGRVHDQVLQAQLRVLAERAMLTAVEAQVLLLAATAYLDVVRDRDVLLLQRDQEAVLARTVAADRTELAAGAITPADLAQSEARRLRQRSAVSTAAAQVAASEAAFEAAVGVAPGALSLPDGEMAVPATEDAVLAEALRADPELVAARRSLEATRLGVDVARDELLPVLSVNALVEHQQDYEYLPFNERANAVQALLQLTVPLYQGGAEYSRIRAAKEGDEQARALVEQAARQTRQIVASGWAALQAARDRVRDAAAATAADRVAEAGLAQLQAVGARTTIDLLNAQQETLSSAVEEVSARHDVLAGDLALLGATGRLDAPALLPSVAPYDPRAHYDAVRGKWAGTSPPARTALSPEVGRVGMDTDAAALGKRRHDDAAGDGTAWCHDALPRVPRREPSGGAGLSHLRKRPGRCPGRHATACSARRPQTPIS